MTVPQGLGSGPGTFDFLTRQDNAAKAVMPAATPATDAVLTASFDNNSGNPPVVAGTVTFSNGMVTLLLTPDEVNVIKDARFSILADTTTIATGKVKFIPKPYLPEEEQIKVDLRADLDTVYAPYGVVIPEVQQYVASSLINNSVIETIATETGYVYALVDADGHMSLAIKQDGTVVINKVALPDGSVSPANLGSDVPLAEHAAIDSYGYSAVWVDQNNKISFWVTLDGKLGFNGLDAVSLSYVGQAVAENGSISPVKYADPKNVVHNITSGPNIICWGDSLTAGAGGNGTTYPSVLQTLVPASISVVNSGVGGETSVTIAARTGATPFLLLPRTGQIPADTSAVAVDISEINGQSVRPLLQGTGGSNFQGTLAGVRGTLALVQPSGASSTWQADDYYTFSRLSAGTAVTVDRPTAFRTDFSEAHRDDIVILWLGQNGPSDARAIADDNAIIEHLTALNKRFLVLSRPTTTDADDSSYHDQFGSRFVAVRQYLVQYGLQDAGITPTAQDTTDISNGTVPTSLRSDSVHLNSSGYTVLANYIYDRLVELGWI